MTVQEAADSMRVTARKLDAWARAAQKLRESDMVAFEQAISREARRLRRDANELNPVSQPPLTRESEAA